MTDPTPAEARSPFVVAVSVLGALAGCYALLAFSGAFAVALSGCGAGDSVDALSATVTAIRGSLEVGVPAEGYLEALSAKAVAVPQVPTGALKVKEVVPEGTIVEAGDVILVFDDTQLNIELSNHRATFRSADRRIDRTQFQSNIDAGSIEVMRQVAELDRDNAEVFDIVDEGIYSKLEILEQAVRKEEAEETVLFAEASLLLRGEYYDIEERILGVEKGQVEGKIGRVETSLANLVLKAPIGGMLVYKKNWRGNTVGVGDTLWPGNVVMSCVDPGSTALKAYVLEKDATGVAVGASASVRVDARPDRAFAGKVKTVAEISSTIERGSPVKYFEVVIELDAGDPELLKPGMKGIARIVTASVEDAVIIPRSALQGEPAAHYVHLLGGERRPIEVGPGDAVRVSVTSGLSGGERLLLVPPPTDNPSPIGAPESTVPDV